MKTQKLLVIVASVCLMAFFNVSSFAQTDDPVQPALAGSMTEVLAQSLAAQGYDVERFGNSLKIATNHGELNLDLTATGEELDDSGIRNRLVPPAEEETDPEKLAQCLEAVDLIYEVNVELCEAQCDTLACTTEAILDRIFHTLRCIDRYVEPPPPSGPVVSVFVTSGKFDGNLGGLAGADAECQAAAEAANLPGTDWTAWLSDGTGNAIDRIPDGQYQLVDGTQVADSIADLTTGTLQAAITLNESGELWGGIVWTGTNPDGTDTGNNCNNWTDNSSGFFGDVGISTEINDLWTYVEGLPSQCNLERNLYCFGGVE